MRASVIICLLVSCAYAAPISNDDASSVSSVLKVIADNDQRVDEQTKFDYQNQASHSHFDHDNAPSHLFESIDKSIFQRPTFAALEKLKLFYHPDSDKNQDTSDSWNSAVSDFLDAVIATNTSNVAQQYLSANGFNCSDAQSYKTILKQLWFQNYGRDGNAFASSSGFKSLFYGEVKGSQVVNFNNWIQFYTQESGNLLDYHGWFEKENGVVIATQFQWGTFEALEQSFLLNTSPEFELSAYTVCFLVGQGDCLVNIHGDSIVRLQVSAPQGKTNIIEQCIPTVHSSGESHTTKHPGSKTTRKHAGVADPDLQTLVNTMRADDVDKPSPSDYSVNWGNKASGNHDNTHHKLFTHVNEAILNRPVYDVLIQLFDKKMFTADVCTAEPAISGARKVAFAKVIDTWTSTKVFQAAFDYMKKKGVKEATDMNTMKSFLFNFWFGTYSRCKGPMGSSGFEHVFSGEWKQSTVDGQHNWQRYYLLERDGAITYYGYYSYDGQLTGTFEYKWANELKQEGGFLFGTSPAFDFSLLTVCSLVHSGAHGCQFTLDGYKLAVTSYTQSCSSGLCLATAYPTN